MSLKRWNPKVDANQPEIIKALKSQGASVQVLSDGKGCPDLLVGYRGCNYLIEVKIPGKKPNKQQVEWAAEWRGGYVYLCYTVEDALTIIQARGRGLTLIGD